MDRHQRTPPLTISQLNTRLEPYPLWWVTRQSHDNAYIHITCSTQLGQWWIGIRELWSTKGRHIDMGDMEGKAHWHGWHGRLHNSDSQSVMDRHQRTMEHGGRHICMCDMEGPTIPGWCNHDLPNCKALCTGPLVAGPHNFVFAWILNTFKYCKLRVPIPDHRSLRCRQARGYTRVGATKNPLMAHGRRWLSRALQRWSWAPLGSLEY
jgi:hypothetical protein